MIKNSPSKTASDVAVSDSAEISKFLSAASNLRSSAKGRGGLVFALDATMSRQHTWDQAQQLQAQMFDVVAQTGGLDVQLVYFRGFGECRASKWVSNASALRDLMTGIECRGGQTQIGKVLNHLRKESVRRNPANPKRSRVDALVFVGDAMEEDIDHLCQHAGELGVLGVPCFMFQEGHDAEAALAFKEIARLSKGAYVRFDAGAVGRLAELLKAVASFVSGGRAALSSSSSSSAKLLLEQLS